MDVSDELLDKYFKGQCSERDRKIVEDYLKTTDELPEHLLNKSEWDNTNEVELSAEKSEALFRGIKQQTIYKHRTKWITAITAAASILIISMLGFLVWKQPQKPMVYANHKPNIVNDKKLTSAINWKSVMNYTNSKQTVSLPDHSVVEIDPGSELRYAVSFSHTNREVFLKGKGFFKVFKDKKHPFIVYAKGIATTALGTSFTITAKEKNNVFKVTLHTGKILVKNTDTSAQALTFSQILLPGNSLVCDIAHKQYNVVNNQLAKADTEHKTKELIFTQTPLAKVLTQLQAAYKTNITYNPDDLKDLAFTGTISVKENLKQILEDLTGLNKLKLIETPKGYQIEK